VDVKRWLPRTVLLLVVLVFAVAAAGCGGDDGGAGGTTAATTGGTGTGGAGQGISVGLVSDTGGLTDRGFNEFSINGLERAEKEFGIETRIYVSKSADDYLPNVTAAAEDDHDLVLAAGFLTVQAVIEVAAEFPDTSFAGIDHFYGTEGAGDGCEEDKSCVLPNTLGLVYPTEEAGYLAGVLAATMTKSGTVSTVGGEKIPPVDNWIAGFHQGAKDTNPDIKLLNAYSQNFTDKAKCKEIALDQLAQGSDVIFQVAGDCGLAAIDAACEEGKFAIGVDADQSAQGDCVVTSALKPLELSVYETVKAFVEGTFKAGTNQFWGLEQVPDSPLLAPYTDDVPQAARDAVDAAEQKIASGEIDPPNTLEKVK
jgi:basic membrane protein A and related proteins